MSYNYAELLGKIKARRMTQKELADAIGVNKATLNLKLNGKGSFTTEEIDSICRVLDIPNNKIGDYFFAN